MRHRCADCHVSQVTPRGGVVVPPLFAANRPPELAPVLRRQSSAAATTGRTQQNTSFVNSSGVPPARTKQNWVVLLGSGCAEPARPCGSGRLRSARALSGGPGLRSPGRAPPAPACAAPPLWAAWWRLSVRPPPPCPPPPAGAGGVAASPQVSKARRLTAPPGRTPEPGHGQHPTAAHSRLWAGPRPAPYRWAVTCCL